VSVLNDPSASPSSSALPISASGDVVVVQNDSNVISLGSQTVDNSSASPTTAKVLIQEDFNFETVSMILFIFHLFIFNLLILLYIVSSHLLFVCLSR
jgi:hypothetical protein